MSIYFSHINHDDDHDDDDDDNDDDSIERAAFDVKWSHDGLRFAASSGAKCVSVCTYEPQNDWWVSKMIKKKFKSTVLCCAFHPTNGQVSHITLHHISLHYIKLHHGITSHCIICIMTF